MWLSHVLDSLKARLLFSMLLLTLIVLPTLAITLNQAFETHLKAAVNDELIAHSYSILSVAEPVDGQLFLPEAVLENQFNVIDSGLYALIYPYTKEHAFDDLAPVWKTASALSFSLVPEALDFPLIGQSSFYESDILSSSGKSSSHFILAHSVSFADEAKEVPVTLFLVKDKTAYSQSVQQFSGQMMFGLFVVFILTMFVQVVWLIWTLKPIAKFRQELGFIKQGESDQIKGKYPVELRLVTEQLNRLLKTEQSQRVRYRNALGDLAHSLKTPLAVMQSSKDINQDIQTQVSKINNIVEHQLKKAQSAGESSWRLGCNIHECAEELVAALAKIYQSKKLIIQVQGSQTAMFRGEQADLTELLGNLLDNACKAAHSKVSLSIVQDNHGLTFQVSDDGNGMTKEQIALALQRGGRADTYEHGHGIGLAIVKDLVTSYDGQLTIERSELGGAQFTIAFRHMSL